MGLSVNQRASAVGVSSEKANIVGGVSLRPEVILTIAQANTGTSVSELNKVKRVFDSDDIGKTYGYGSPINLAKEAFFGVNKGGEFYILPVGDPTSGAAAASKVTVGAGTASKAFTGYIYTKGYTLSFGVSLGDDQDAIANSIKSVLSNNIRMPFNATINVDNSNEVDLAANWQGVDGNEILFEIYDVDGNAIDAVSYGVSISYSSFTGGTGSVDLTNSIAAIPSNLAVTRIINQFKDEANLNLIETYGNDRRDPLIGEYVVSYSSLYQDPTNTSTAFNALVSAGDARINDQVNSLLSIFNQGLAVEGVADLVANITLRYSENAGQPPRGLQLNLATSKPRSDVWYSMAQRNTLYKDHGIPNFEYKNNVYRIMDLCVCYHPANDNINNPQQPINFNDEDITALGNMQYDLKTTFEGDQWLAVKFVADTDLKTKSFVRNLSDVYVTVYNCIDNYIDQAFLKDAAYAKENSIVAFDGSNPERVNVKIIGKMATTGRVYDIVLSLSKAAG